MNQQHNQAIKMTPDAAASYAAAAAAVVPSIAGTTDALTEKLRQVVPVRTVSCLQIKPFAHSIRLGQAVSELESYSWILLTHPQAVETFFSVLLNRRVDVRRMHAVKFAAVDDAVKTAVEQRGILVEYLPLGRSVPLLADGLARRVHQKEKLLLLRGQNESKELAALLGKHGVACDDVPVFEQAFTGEPAPLSAQEAAVFLSPERVRAFAQSVESLEQLRERTAVCLDEATAVQARLVSMRAVVSPEATLQSLVKTTVQVLESLQT